MDIFEHILSDTIDVTFFLVGRWPPHLKWRMVTLEALAECDELCAALLALTSDWRCRRIAIDTARATLLGLLDVIEHRCREVYSTWPDDVYRHAIVHHFVDRQLLLSTHADQQTRTASYAHCLNDETWNAVNWHLGGPESLRNHTEPDRSRELPPPAGTSTIGVRTT
ncbi:hypothetical protein ACFQX7_27905 [Luedemannella flava]